MGDEDEDGNDQSGAGEVSLYFYLDFIHRTLLHIQFEKTTITHMENKAFLCGC